MYVCVHCIYVYIDDTSFRYPVGSFGVLLTLDLYKMFLVRSFCARISTVICKLPFCLGTPPLPVIARTMCAIDGFRPTPLYCNIYHTILIMAILCEGQADACHFISLYFFPSFPGSRGGGRICQRRSLFIDIC